MDINKMMKEMKEVFIEEGFEPVDVGGTEMLRYGDCYHMITHLPELNAAVIESAFSYDEAIKHMHEDDDLFFAEDYDSDEKLREELRELLRRGYMV
jgi:hypothetical protein